MRRELISYEIEINNITKKTKRDRIKINIIITYLYDYIKRYILTLIKELFEIQSHKFIKLFKKFLKILNFHEYRY